MSFTQPLPAALSPSRLQDFQKCPRRYQHGSIDRIHQPATYATAKGNVVHEIMEHLFSLAPEQRTPSAAHEYIASAEASVLTAEVRDEISLDNAKAEKLRREIVAILDTYFSMEDPTAVTTEGVELRLTESLDGAPVLGILDRLDRNDDGSLSIVDYKTGSLPNRRFDTQTFANAEIYAALCEAHCGERPTSIKLMYVSHGETIERPVSEITLRARRESAARTWTKIVDYYERGDFPATPSINACRFCAFQDLCRSNGIAVPV